MEKVQVNNEYYHDLGEGWHTADDDPIALLRAESKIKNPWVIETILETLGPGKKDILDVGCGAGFLSNAMAVAGHSVSGLDMSNESLAIAKKYDETNSVNYLYGDAYQLPFENESFDVVSAMDFLEHVEEPVRVIQEAQRVLKPGGVFFFHTFSKNILAYLVVIKLVEWFLPKTPKHLHILRLFISPKELEKMCTLAKLKVVHMHGIKPVLSKWSFWSSLLKRRIHPDFKFEFTKSTLISYIGYAKK